MSRKSSEHAASPMGVGVITIFMVLIVLCLAILATLTLSTARADLHLSQINAETATAYYRADGQAAELYADFAAGGEAHFETTIEMTENQVLYVRFGRDSGGEPVVLAWQTQSVLDASEWDEFLLPIWQGE